MIQAKEAPTRNVQNRLLHFEDCKQAVDQLFCSALIRQGPDAFGKFLDFAKTFNNLSIYNAMLVMVQRPGAAMVGNPKHWEEIGRHVLPDAVPIIILRPFGPIQFLYELNDTGGRSLPSQDKNPLFAHGEVTEELFERTRKAAEIFSVEVVDTDQYGDHLAGTAAGLGVYPERITSDDKKAFRVKLNAKHDLPTRYSTLAHELGHIYCGHLGMDAKGRWPARFLSPRAMELEAEAVAWVVCHRNGITTRSREYLSGLTDEASLKKVSMYVIYEAANRVEARNATKKV